MSAGTCVAQLAGTYKLTKCPDFTQEKQNAHFCSSCVRCFLVAVFLVGLFSLVCVSFITIMTFRFYYKEILESLSLKMNFK